MKTLMLLLGVIIILFQLIVDADDSIVFFEHCPPLGPSRLNTTMCVLFDLSLSSEHEDVKRTNITLDDGLSLDFNAQLIENTIRWTIEDRKTVYNMFERFVKDGLRDDYPMCQRPQNMNSPITICQGEVLEEKQGYRCAERRLNELYEVITLKTTPYSAKIFFIWKFNGEEENEMEFRTDYIEQSISRERETQSTSSSRIKMTNLQVPSVSDRIEQEYYLVRDLISPNNPMFFIPKISIGRSLKGYHPDCFDDINSYFQTNEETPFDQFSPFKSNEVVSFLEKHLSYPILSSKLTDVSFEVTVRQPNEVKTSVMLYPRER